MSYLKLAAWSATALLLGTGPTLAQATPPHCKDLTGTMIPAEEIGMKTTGAKVTAVEEVAASGEAAAQVPAHCLVSGAIHPVDPEAPDILFNVALPVDWNGKVLMMGGGGFNGSVPNVLGNVPAGPSDQPRPIGRGYAVFASDSGHQANEFKSQDGAFALNQEAERNFGGDALKKTRDAAVYLIKAHYGREIDQHYFAGGSTGGREALAAITRWPDDWDGAIAWYPAWNDVAALLGGQAASRALAQPGAYPDTPARQLIFDAAMAACDDLDGARDGLVSNQTLCNATFDPRTAQMNGKPVMCQPGQTAEDGCLTEAQITALEALNEGVTFNFPLASGEKQYPGYNVWGSDLGLTNRTASIQPIVTFLALGTTQPATPMERSTPYVSFLLDQWIKYSVTRDPDFDSLTLDPANPGAWGTRISELSTLLDTRVDLDGFHENGGKLLLAHGLSDVLVSTRATQQYYLRLQARMGPEVVDEFVRYYEVPGYGHAVSSDFNAAWDSLTALEQWREKDIAPQGEIVTDTVGVPGRTRPLCDYPAWPKYRGEGEMTDAAAFVCSR
ncbi:tannase/feruloyl esterase family alpha/beta hydrolase [Pseudooceanicola sp. 216_PA32_1]|uniref:Tannase/feruloyl esterase family alpha/beta hydrolase n=1 Tax=Pseudooceanicola pacificus TaxID=2676438 RepID=A0A844WBQ7_9RHOB|nr:tannase/feruloyl esterase family alpha/beta hydrolase [Pseudooceanicola pacificus]MWB78308.1 tannase/feruloyl esterase family alpha/beta hydrolase [Pseudooceanicola pacificus]